MAILTPEIRDILNALIWYMTARKTALRAALSFRAPLSVTAQIDMRVQYSSYFQNLLSATELMRESTPLQPTYFENELYAQFVFPGFSDGKSNYEYIKYLRNAIIHRGYDITSSAEIEGDFVKLIAKPCFKNNATNPAKIKTYQTFDKYVLGIIKKCESVIGNVILKTLDNTGIFQTTIDTQAAIAEICTDVHNSQVMPEWAKEMFASMDLKANWFTEMDNLMKKHLREALTPCDSV